MERLEQLQRLLRPERVAVVGASPRPGWGSTTIENLAALGYGGEIYPVNPRYSSIGGRPCYPSVSRLPSVPDVAVFAVPAAAVPDLVEEAVTCGVPAGVVYASGFGAPGEGEGGDAGAEAPRQRLENLCRDGRIALLGPNCLGVVNYARRVALWGISMTGEHAGTEKGVALIAQSGNMALTLSMANRAMPLTHLISCGNQFAVTAAELVEAVLSDSAVRAVAIILEGVPDVAEMRNALVTAAERDVPVIVLKIGQSERGQAAAIAHTGTLSGPAALYRGLFRQFGAIQVDDLDELASAAALAASGHRPGGRNLAVFASSGGECGLVSDLAETTGVDLPDLPAQAAESIGRLLPEYGKATNPLDITAGGWGDAELYAAVVEHLGRVEGIDAVVAIADAPTLGGGGLEDGFRGIIAGLVEGARRLGPAGPVVTSVSSVGDLHGEVLPSLVAGGVVPLCGLRPGLSALAKFGWYAEWRARHDGSVPGLSGRSGEAGAPGGAPALSAIISGSFGGGASSLLPAGGVGEDLAKACLSAYGISSPDRRLVRTPGEAVAAADVIGYPVVAKVAAGGVHHKSDLGGVLLGLDGPAAVEDGARKLLALAGSVAAGAQPVPPGLAGGRAGLAGGLAGLAGGSAGLAGRPAGSVAGVLIEKYVPGGIELIVGGRRDESFGPVVMLGLGGVLTELMEDVVHRLAPLAVDEAGVMVDELAGRHLLDGYRGLRGVDVTELALVVAAVSRLLSDHDRVLEVEINPLVPSGDGRKLLALDALLVLGD